jgi:hypothetical protein
MTKLITKSFLCIFAVVLFSGAATVKKDAKALYSELKQGAAPNTLDKSEKKNGWVLLFNGTTSDGWRGYNLTGFPDCWVVKDGTLTMTTEGKAESQDIITAKMYHNFAFSVDFKLTKGANSGIIFQINEDKKYKFPYETGPEFQLIDQDNWKDKLEDWQICGANYAMYPPVSKPSKPVGEWNHLLLVVDGNNVTQIINGVVVVKYVKNSEEWLKLRKSGKWADYPDYGKFDEGFISLQNHGTQVYFRNIKIKELK